MRTSAEAIARVRALTPVLAETRREASEQADAVIRGVEEALVGALGGDTLRGMPDLAPGRGFHARRVHANGREGSAAQLVWGKWVPVITSKGRLVWAKVGDHREPVAREPDEGELNADLLGPYLDAVQAALEDHLARTERRVQSYEAASDLARKIASVIGLHFR